MKALSSRDSDRRYGALTALLAALVVGAAACWGGAESTNDPLDGSRWEMTSVWDGAAVVGANPTTIATMVFSDGTAHGFTGCNHYQTGYSIEPGSVAFGELSLTGSVCDPSYTAQGDAFVRAAQASTSFTVGPDNLALADASGSAVLWFRPAQELPLTGIAWRLAWYGAGTAPLDGSVVSLAFRTDGTLLGGAGCNEYFADYDLDGNRLTIGPVASTDRACLVPEGVMSQETQYLTALSEASGFITSLTGLQLMSEAGVAVAEYQFGGRTR